MKTPSPQMEEGVFPVILGILVMILGVPGNCLILCVYSNRPRKPSTQVLITALAWIDLGSCATLPVLTIGRYVSVLTATPVPVIFYMLDNTLIITSIMIVSIIAFDRFDCVCRPHKRFFNPKRARYASWGVLVLSTATVIPANLHLIDPSIKTQILQRYCLCVCYTCVLFVVLVCYSNIYKTVKKRKLRLTDLRSRGRINTTNRSGEHKKCCPQTVTPLHGIQLAWTSGNRSDNIKTSVTKMALHLNGDSEEGAMKNNRTFQTTDIQSNVRQSQHTGCLRYPVEPVDSKISTVSAKIQIMPCSQTQSSLASLISSGINMSGEGRKQMSEVKCTINKLMQTAPAATSKTKRSQTNQVSHEIQSVSEEGHCLGRNIISLTDSSVGTNINSLAGGQLATPVAARLQRRTTRMMLFTSLVLLTSWIPEVILSAIVLAQCYGVGSLDTAYDIFYNLGWLIFINSAVNPFIYSLANQRFRKDSITVLRKLFKN